MLCCCAGLTLSIKRLVLLNVTVAPLASATHSPKLLPLGLFAQPVTNLTLVDVHFSVPPDIFQQYLAFFSTFLLAVKTKSDGGVGMHTVRQQPAPQMHHVAEAEIPNGWQLHRNARAQYLRRRLRCEHTERMLQLLRCRPPAAAV